MEKFMGRFKKKIQRTGEVLESVMAIIVLFGIVLSVYSLLKDFEIFHSLAAETEAFKPFLYRNRVVEGNSFN